MYSYKIWADSWCHFTARLSEECETDLASKYFKSIHGFIFMQFSRGFCCGSIFLKQKMLCVQPAALSHQKPPPESCWRHRPDPRDLPPTQLLSLFPSFPHTLCAMAVSSSCQRHQWGAAIPCTFWCKSQMIPVDLEDLFWIYTEFTDSRVLFLASGLNKSGKANRFQKKVQTDDNLYMLRNFPIHFHELTPVYKHGWTGICRLNLRCVTNIVTQRLNCVTSHLQDRKQLTLPFLNNKSGPYNKITV